MSALSFKRGKINNSRSRYSRYLVFFGLMDVFHPRLAGKNQRFKNFPPHQSDGNRLRYLVFLGSANDYHVDVSDGGGPVQTRVSARVGARRAGSQDVKIVGKYH